MDFCLIAVAWWADPSVWIAVLKVTIGLGMVIFVHELGHFAVAKACGVKCEKFYLGFDIAGWKLCKFTYGETEYGIGVLPFGGYVKMLGQEDNPAKLREEIERAKLQQTAQDESPETAEKQTSPESEPPNSAKPDTAKTDGQEAGEESSEDAPCEPIDLAAAEQALYDPRSYLAQSVPKRMAIISAGVIMNLIFAFILATIAFLPSMGVQRRPCVVGGLMPGETAWQQDIRVGDRILKIADKKIRKFRDMQEAISLGDDLEQGLSIEIARPDIARPGVEERLTFEVMPNSSGLIPRIGIRSASTTTFSSKGPLAVPGSAAARCRPALEPGDTIVRIDDVSIEDHPAPQQHMVLQRYLALHPDKSLTLTVARKAKADSAKEASAEMSDGGGHHLVEIEMPVNPMRRLGLVMEMGEISAVQDGSPAAMAGVQPGDKIVSIDGESPGDPLTLPDRLRRRVGEVITLTLNREAEADPIYLRVKLRPADRFDLYQEENSPVTVPVLGIAYPVLNRVHTALDGSPADKAGLRAGDVLRSAKFIPPPESQTPTEDDFELVKKDIDFDEEHRNWPVFVYFLLQYQSPGAKVELTWERQKEELTAMLEPVAAADWFNPDRGFSYLGFEPLYTIEKADSFGEAVRLGAGETCNSTLLVYRFLQKIGTQVSPRMLGGPISIFRVAIQAADQGTAALFIFLTLLSANLAVINFLPIPLLDGGHMVLLAWEGIRGKPADERIQLVLTYFGLFFILGLMFWVIALDIGLISRQ
ncbi:MAG: site-2 protease family protein [Thermoguttaceae bacterium]